MSDIFDTIKSSAEKAKDGAVKIGKHVVDKTSSFMNLTKIKFAIGEEESKIKEVYTEIGKVIYDNYTKGDYVEDDIRSFCEKIDKHTEELMILRKRAEEMEGSTKCPNCGTYNKKESAFCSKCGAPTGGTDCADEEEPEEVITIKPVKPDENDD